MAHIFCSILIGLIFFGSGNDASMVRSNLAFVFGVLIFLVYVGKMSVTLASKFALRDLVLDAVSNLKNVVHID